METQTTGQTGRCTICPFTKESVVCKCEFSAVRFIATCRARCAVVSQFNGEFRKRNYFSAESEVIGGVK